jgi:hypothetical protein
MPEEGYEPRADDFRVGYFGQRVTNLTDTSVTPYDDVINRWRLVKQDPDAEISDPVEPIVWWIENTTPVELRDTIRDAALTWNIAFEAAGFSNAMEVRVQPDDADWDAGDIRYNVLRWTSSPTPPFGGYGPSFTNPRTGEIIGADIMLEYVFLTNRIRYSELFDVAGLSQWLPAEQLAEATGEPVIEHRARAHGAMCNFAEHLQMETLAGLAALQAQGATTVKMNELIRQSLHYLVIHEIGHTLGLMHNMRASSTISLEELANGETVTGSIMDYPALNLPMHMTARRCSTPRKSRARMTSGRSVWLHPGRGRSARHSGAVHRSGAGLSAMTPTTCARPGTPLRPARHDQRSVVRSCDLGRRTRCADQRHPAHPARAASRSRARPTSRF